MLAANTQKPQKKKETDNDEKRESTNIEDMMMKQVSIPRPSQNEHEAVEVVYDDDKKKENKENAENAPEIGDKRSTLNTEDLRDIAHEKTNTFVINLNAEDNNKIFEDQEEDEEDDDNLQITK